MWLNVRIGINNTIEDEGRVLIIEMQYSCQPKFKQPVTAHRLYESD